VMTASAIISQVGSVSASSSGRSPAMSSRARPDSRNTDHSAADRARLAERTRAAPATPSSTIPSAKASQVGIAHL
jgi:hypothetical protein